MSEHLRSVRAILATPEGWLAHLHPDSDPNATQEKALALLDRAIATAEAAEGKTNVLH